MKTPVRGLLGLLLCVSALGVAARPAHAALYWFHGVRTAPVSVCFVGNAVTKQANRVRQVATFIKEYEYAGNVHWVTVGGKPLADRAQTNISELACPAPTQQGNGNDYYAGDIRVVLYDTSVSGTGATPGKGCPAFRDKNGKYDGTNEGWGSFSFPPDSLQTDRSCIYNLKLGNDPWPQNGKPAGNPPSTHPYLNHTLHEFGHALGLAHEHSRNDVDSAHCSANGYGGNATDGHMTPYDRRSVMHYQFLACGINGNYDNTGLSPWDQLAVHIMYPEATPVAEMVGATVIPQGTPLNLRSGWEATGANMNFVAQNYQWTVDGNGASSGPDLSVSGLIPGSHTVHFSYTDFLGRAYSNSTTVRVLTPHQYNGQTAATTAAIAPLL